MTNTHAELDSSIRSLCESRDFEAAVTRTLERYGAEVLSFLRARMRSESDADEAFAMAAEDLWHGLPGFGFRCSVRGWMYTLARNAANRYAAAPHNRRGRNVSLSAPPVLQGLIARTRSQTGIHKRTEIKQRIRALREQLSLEDQTLLMLHIDRGLPFRELAMVMHDDGERLDGESLARETARLRKRFERIKQELRELAVAAGLLKD